MEKGAVRKVQNWLKTVPDSFEGKLYSALLAGFPPESQLFIANSMPVRDAERFWPVDETKRVRVFSNRGASGIDGLVSTVAGLADGGPPTVAVLGDLSFLHDTGGLRVAAAIEGRLDIIVIDNGGGRIFEQLPIHSREDIFEDYFLTPQQVDLSRICEAHGIPAIGFSGVSDLVEAVKAKSTGARVLILKTDPAEDRKVRESWRALWTLREKD